MFSLMSVCLSTLPTRQATYAAGGMPLAVSQEDFLVSISIHHQQILAKAMY